MTVKFCSFKTGDAAPVEEEADALPLPGLASDGPAGGDTLVLFESNLEKSSRGGKTLFCWAFAGAAGVELEATADETAGFGAGF